MAKLEELVLSLIAETSGLRAELQKASKETDKFASDMDRAISKLEKNSTKNLTMMETAFANMAGYIASNIVLGAVSKVGEVFSFLSNQLMEGVNAANEGQAAILRLANSLALTGQYSEQALLNLTDYSNQVGRATNISSTLIQQNIALLSSMTKLNSEGLQKATQAAIDLATAYDLDLRTATVMIGKGIEGNVTAFQRYGITVQEGTNRTENLSNILKGLATTQGAAEGKVKNFNDQLGMTVTAFGKLPEAVAKTVTMNESVIITLDVLTKKFYEAEGGLNANNLAMQKVVSQGLSNLLDGFAMVTISLDAIERVSSATFYTMAASIQGLNTVVYGLLSLLSDSFDEAFQNASRAADEAMKNMSKSLTGDTFLGTVTETLLQMKQASDSGFGALRDGVTTAIEPTVKLGEAIDSLTAKQLQSAEQGKLLAEQLILDSEENGALKLEILNEQLESERELLELSREAELTSIEKFEAAKTELEKKYADLRYKQEAESKNKKQKLIHMMQSAEIKTISMGADLINTIAAGQSKEAFIISKVAAMAQAQVNTALALTQAMAQVPIYAYPAVAAQIKMQGGLQMATIAASAIQGLQSGIDSIPGIGSRDSFPAMLAPGERVVPTETNKDLKEYLRRQNNGEMSGGRQSIEISLNENIVNFIEAKLVERMRTGESTLRGEKWA